MELDTIILYILVAAYIGEKSLSLYKRVMADGKVTLDEVIIIIEEVSDMVALLSPIAEKALEVLEEE